MWVFGMIVILVSILVASGKISCDKYRFGESTELNQTWVYVTALLLSLSFLTENVDPLSSQLIIR